MLASLFKCSPRETSKEDVYYPVRAEQINHRKTITVTVLLLLLYFLRSDLHLYLGLGSLAYYVVAGSATVESYNISL